MRLRRAVRMRSPAVTMPARFSGSAALIVTSAAVGRRAAHLAQPLDRVAAARTARPTCRTRTGRRGSRRAPRAGGRRAPARATARALASRVEQPPEHDAVAAEQRPRLRLDGRVARDASPSPRASARPAAGEVRAPIARRRPAARGPTIARAGRRSRRTRPARRRRARRCAWRSCVGVERRSAAARSLKNDAPRDAQRLEHARASSARASPASASRRRSSRSAATRRACSRRNSAIGVAGTSRVGSPVRRREPRPADLAGQAQHVEHRRLVAVEPRRQHRALPRAAASSKPSSCATTSRRPSRPVSRRDGSTCCQREQEAHEVGRADRLDLRAQAVERVAMDAREQRAVAPLESSASDRRARREPAAQHDALGLRARAAPRRRRASATPSESASAAAVVGPGNRQPAAQQLDDRVVARPRRAPRATAAAAIGRIDVASG